MYATYMPKVCPLRVAHRTSTTDQRRGERKRTPAHDKHQRIAHRRLRKAPAPPLMFVRRPNIGLGRQLVASITNSPQEVDDTVQSAWWPICTDNIDMRRIHDHSLAGHFISKYGSWVVTSQACRASRICPDRLMGIGLQDPATSNGMDERHRTRNVCLKEAFEFLAALLDTIEEGAPWPCGILGVRAAFLGKDEEPHWTPSCKSRLLRFQICCMGDEMSCAFETVPLDPAVAGRGPIRRDAHRRC